MKQKIITFSLTALFSISSITDTFTSDILYGDITKDGAVTAIDVAVILENALNGNFIKDEDTEIADVSKDSIITVEDAAILLQKVLNSTYVMPCETYTTESTTENSTENNISSDVYITLSDNASSTDGNGVTIENNTITITTAGTYYVSGSLSDGCIVVNSEEDVEIVLNGVEITNTSGPAINGISGDLDLKLEKNTENILTDGSSYSEQDESGEPDACVFSKDRITVKGSGSLTINANYGDGIGGKDELEIKNGNITINSADDGIRAKDYIEITGGTINVAATSDGIKCTKGYISINESKNNVDINVNAAKNGIKAETYMTITDALINVECNNNSVVASTGDLTVKTAEISCTAIGTDTENYNYDGLKSSESSVYVSNSKIICNVSQDAIQSALLTNIEDSEITFTSSDNGITSDENIILTNCTINGNSIGKGIKSGTNTVITDGTYVITSTDDTIHSNGNITINSGTFTLSTEDDGIHADETLTIEGGEIDILNSYEGLEAVKININGGNTSLKASDDGINANGGADNSGFGGGDKNNPWGNRNNNNNSSSSSSEDSGITINDGYIFVNSGGDGLDANGYLTFNGGTVIVYGSTNSADAAIDADGTISYNGGILSATGSSGMAQAPSSTASSGYSVMYNGSALSANNLIVLTDSNGNVISAIKPEKTYSSVVFCSPLITSGQKISIYSGGNYSGTFDENGYSTGGTYNAGTLLGSATISSKTTTIGSSQQNPGGRGMMKSEHNNFSKEN